MKPMQEKPSLPPHLCLKAGCKSSCTRDRSRLISPEITPGGNRAQRLLHSFPPFVYLPEVCRPLSLKSLSCHLFANALFFLKMPDEGRQGGSVGWASGFGSGHDLTVREFEPRVGLCADCSEPGACFTCCVSLSDPPPFMLCLSLSQK